MKKRHIFINRKDGVMTMKKRHIFIIGLIALLLACPSCMIYITVKQQENYKKKSNQW